MNFFLELAFLFFVGSIGGWILELLFRRFFSAHRWVNPGFLTGPYLPLYGFGLAILHLFCEIDLSFIDNGFLREGLRIIIITFSLTLIEYIAGLIFIKGMNIKLWDYSDRWGNIQGIICPLFTIFWGLIAVLYLFVINPYIISMLDWFYNNITFSFFVGLFFGILLVDFAFSMNLAVKIKQFAKENKVLVSFEHLKEKITEKSEKFSERFLTPLYTVKNTIVKDTPKFIESLIGSHVPSKKEKKQKAEHK